jgi:opacity protein-like surface antigen
MPRGKLALLTLSLVALSASPGRADVLLTPFVGASVGGSSSSALFQLAGDADRTNFGASLALMSGGVLGIEADFGYTPRFFGAELPIATFPVTIAQNRVITAMANLTAGVPLQSRSGVGVRPYGVAGLGLIRQQIDVLGGFNAYTSNDLGYDIGGGIMLFFGPHVGVRGDIRHFRSVGGGIVSDLIDLDPGAFNFTRTSVGVTFRY